MQRLKDLVLQKVVARHSKNDDSALPFLKGLRMTCVEGVWSNPRPGEHTWVHARKVQKRGLSQERYLVKFPHQESAVVRATGPSSSSQFQLVCDPLERRSFPPAAHPLLRTGQSLLHSLAIKNRRDDEDLVFP